MFHVFNNNYNEYESDGDKSKVLSIKKYFNQIKPYLVDIINNLKNQGEWKIQFEAWLNAWKSNNSFITDNEKCQYLAKKNFLHCFAK